MPITDYVDDKAIVTDEIELKVEEIEEVIAPLIAANHNETLVNDEVELGVDDLEEVNAPGLLFGEDLQHNETLVSDEVELSIEELEETLTPTPSIPIPPPLSNR